MRILVCGGRHYTDECAVYSVLDSMREQYGTLTIIQGGARGADHLARRWCWAQRSVRLINEPADWKTHGRAAGPKRNATMLSEHKPDLVIAFPGGRGTEDMKRQARAAGVEVVEVKA